MTNRSIVSPDDQTVTFVELFFDLVFVFSVTQVVGLFHHGISWALVGQALLVFWLVWWAWTQFTWSLNAANTQHPVVQFGTLLATAIVFFMAITLPEAFGAQSAWFGVAYVLVRILGLSLYVWVASQDPIQKRAVRTFTLVSIGGLVAVLVGAVLGGTAQLILWGLAILLDILAAQIGGRIEGWNLHPEHFTERHGLFVIIALGETLIVAASAVNAELGFDQTLIVAILAVVTTCGLWWSYFARIKPRMDHALESSAAFELTQMARDAYSLVHFIMMAGVVAYAVAIEEALAHPSEPLLLVGRIFLAVGIALFMGGIAAAAHRTARITLNARILLVVLTAILLVGLGGISVVFTLGIACAGVLVIVIVEQRSGDLVAESV